MQRPAELQTSAVWQSASVLQPPLQKPPEQIPPAWHSAAELHSAAQRFSEKLHALPLGHSLLLLQNATVQRPHTQCSRDWQRESSAHSCSSGVLTPTQKPPAPAPAAPMCSLARHSSSAPRSSHAATPSGLRAPVKGAGVS